MNKKSKIITAISTVLLIIFFIIAIYLSRRNNIERNLDIKSNTYFYDKDGDEILSVDFGDTEFFKNINSYYIQATVDNILKDMMNKESISVDEAEQELATGGYRIYTNQDSKIQTELDKIYNDNNNFIENSDSASIVLDNKTNEVRGVVGGRNTKNESIYLNSENYVDPFALMETNRAINSKFQPGTALTLISVYAYGFENGIINKDSIYKDEPLEMSDWKPKNYYREFRGDITIEDAIKIMSNLVAIRVEKDIGLENSYKFLQDVGISSLDEKDINLASMALGGLTYGVNLLELSTAYRTILNDGIYKSPMFYNKITDTKGEIYLQNNQVTKTIVKQSVCDTIRSIIKDNINGEEVYLKSDGTNQNFDNWANGSNNKYTITTWYGADDLRSINSNKNEAEFIWKKILEILPK